MNYSIVQFTRKIIRKSNKTVYAYTQKILEYLYWQIHKIKYGSRSKSVDKIATKKLLYISIFIGMVLIVIKRIVASKMNNKSHESKTKFKKSISIISVHKKINRNQSFCNSSKKNYQSHSDSIQQEQSASEETPVSINMKKTIPIYFTDIETDCIQTDKLADSNIEEKRGHFFLNFIIQFFRSKKQRKNSSQTQQKSGSHHRNQQLHNKQDDNQDSNKRTGSSKQRKSSKNSYGYKSNKFQKKSRQPQTFKLSKKTERSQSFHIQ